MAKKGHIPWNKGKKGVQKHSESTRLKISKSHLGKVHSEATKKIQSNKKLGDKNPMFGVVGAKHPSWKGDDVGYQGIHAWVRKIKGKPRVCEFCRRTESLGWANKDHSYRRIKTDWTSLCASCHKKYDLQNN